MRLILNVIVYALLFYAVWYFFPETFETITRWIGDLFNFLKEQALRLSEYFSGSHPPPPHHT